MSAYANLLACYRSGQMGAAQFHRHMREDAAFAAFVEKETAKTATVGNSMETSESASRQRTGEDGNNA